MIRLEQSSPQIESVRKSLAQNCSNAEYRVEQSTYWIHVAWNYPHFMWNISFTLTDLKRYIKEYELNQENLLILHWYIVICLALNISAIYNLVLYIYISLLWTRMLIYYFSQLFAQTACIDIIFCSIYLFSLLFYRNQRNVELRTVLQEMSRLTRFCFIFLCPVVSLFLFHSVL